MIRERLALFIILCIALLAATAWLDAQSADLQSLGGQADRITDKRIERKSWGGGSEANLGDKTFRIEEWEKHFSPLGGKRADIEASDSWGRGEIVEKKIKEFPKREFEMSDWNERMADLQKRAGLSTDQTAEMAGQNGRYNRMLRKSQSFPEMAETLSLKDINRYQFRRNRPDGEVPVERAGRAE